MAAHGRKRVVSNTPLTSDQVLALLEAAPSRIVEYTSGLTDAQLRAAHPPGEWSANEILAHLRSCADVWGSSILTILDEDKPTIRAVNPRTWIQSTDYLTQEFRPSMHAFSVQRTQLLKVLKPLKPNSWSRSATVTGAGKPLTRTVHFYAEWLATHERTHVNQLHRMASV